MTRREMVLAALAAAGAPQTTAEVAASLGWSDDLARTTLSKLAAHGAITSGRRCAGMHGRAVQWHLTPTQQWPGRVAGCSLSSSARSALCDLLVYGPMLRLRHCWVVCQTGAAYLPQTMACLQQRGFARVSADGAEARATPAGEDQAREIIIALSHEHDRLMAGLAGASLVPDDAPAPGALSRRLAALRRLQEAP